MQKVIEILIFKYYRNPQYIRVNARRIGKVGPPKKENCNSDLYKCLNDKLIYGKFML